ncbi:MAG TPA: lipopolysaccharide heptosyltransferase II [Bryobacteraceae bacterium]|nr:lipopolysaccharide heptosyltransferase II [Bryobacteraceae bacterium]
MQFRNILVRATDWVGDAVMSIPALHALRARFPDAHISILARPWVAGVYGREPVCDAIIPYEPPRGWNGLRPKWRLSAELRRRKFDCAILLPNSFESAALARLAEIPIRVGYARDARSWLLTHPIPVPLAGETPAHQRFYYLELLKRAKLIDGYSLDSSIRLSSAKAVQARDNSVRTIGVSPGAAHGGAKRWLPERFAEAAVQIAHELGASVAIFGSKEELDICELVRRSIAAAGVPCTNFAGKTTLAEFIELAPACDVFLTNDSGAMHIASALGVPTVAIFGATDDQATGPTDTHSRVVREPVECSPCLRQECPIDHRCMTRVDAARVAETALSLVVLDRQNA